MILAGLRVVEFATEIAGPYCGKLLADAGADVIKVEPQAGDPLRRRRPAGEIDGDGDGALFKFLNAGKRSVTGTPADPRVRALVDDADVIIESFRPAALDIGALRSRAPGLVIVSITPYGRGTSWADRPATEFTIQAEGGSFGCRGDRDREPLQAGGRPTEWLGGALAAVAALGAVSRVRRGGPGEHVDHALIETAALTMNCFPELMAVVNGRPGQPLDPNGRRVERPSIERTRDGWVGFNTNTRPQLESFLLLIERPDLLTDDRVLTAQGRTAMGAEFDAIVRAWTTTKTTAEIVEAASLLRIPVAPVNDGAKVLAHPHFRARGFIAWSPDGSFEQPLPPYQIDGERPRPQGPAPALGEHTATADPRPPGGPAAANSSWLGGQPPRALEGLRVLDATGWWAGPFAAQLLTAFGADVIHLESAGRPDGGRTAANPAFASWWERAPLFLATNTNKRDVTLALDREQGRAIVERLIAHVDVVVENYSPRVFEHFGFTWEHLHAINPRLILVRMPAFGTTGPWRDNVGFAQTMEQMSGMAWVTGYADGEPRIPLGPCDPNAGIHAAFATLLAVERRRQTGRGALVEATMVESAVNVMAEQVVSASAYGTSAVRAGNRGPDAAPQGVYQCAGTEQWLALAIATDEQWRALAGVLGQPAWAADPGLARPAGRRRAHDEIDRAVGAWAAEQDLQATVERLVRAGVPAAVVADPRRISGHPLLRERGFFEYVDHPVAGTLPIPGPALGLASVGRWHYRRPPLLGEHTAEVLAQLLGLTAAEVAELEASGVSGRKLAGA
jgi:crotonobetainyl-CoA:carnitine CoA-transferase CaiB-like acyl-CoA transferase